LTQRARRFLSRLRRLLPRFRRIAVTRTGYPRLSALRCLTSLACSRLLCPLLTPARRSARISPRPVLPDTAQTSRGKTRNLPHADAGFIKHTPMGE